MDLSKAFHTLDHTTLLNKRNLYGIRGTPLSLFNSYLNDRKQYVLFNDDINSSFCTIKTGVTQGSIQEPLLFIIYVNDMSNLEINDVEISLFADDTVYLLVVLILRQLSQLVQILLSANFQNGLIQIGSH